MRPLDLDGFATANHGLVSRAAAGLSAGQWKRALDAGHFELVHPMVARLPGTARTPEQRIAAAVLAAGPGALASHRSAARLWGFARPDGDPVDIILPGRRRDTQPAGVVVHRPTDHGRLAPARRSNIRCTNPLRTLIDLGAVDPAGVTEAVGAALGDRLLDLDALRATVWQHARRGRAGVRALRDAVVHWSLDGKPADSELEVAMRRLTTRYHLPELEFHPIIEGWEVDFRMTGTALLLECDGWTTHGLDRDQFERDRSKADDLHGAGWIVCRFTYRSVVAHPADTARRLRRTVDRWSHLTPPDRILDGGDREIRH
jgi:very-short-patch-repair endonuclease